MPGHTDSGSMAVSLTHDVFLLLTPDVLPVLLAPFGSSPPGLPGKSVMTKPLTLAITTRKIALIEVRVRVRVRVRVGVTGLGFGLCHKPRPVKAHRSAIAIFFRLR